MTEARKDRAPEKKAWTKPTLEAHPARGAQGGPRNVIKTDGIIACQS
jgi:hypothetical protein